MKISKSNSLFALVSVGIVCLYLISRFQNLLAIPVFGDEAIYLRWSQIIKNEETMRFVPVGDGKQPFFMWLTVPFFKIFSDPLLAGRAVSVMSGLGIIFGLYFIFFFISRHRWQSLLPVIIYLFLPFSFFFDRLSLPDNLLSFFGVFSLLFALLLSKYPRFDLSMVLGLTLGLAWLTKSPAIYFLALSWFTFFLYSPKNFKYWYLPLISSLIAFTIYNILRLGPQFHMIGLRNLDYVWPIGEILKHPLDPLKPHLIDLFHIYRQFIGAILVLLLVFLRYRLPLATNKLILVLVAWWLGPVILNCAVAKSFTARYILYTLPSLILLLSLIFFKISAKLKYLILALLLIPNLIYIINLSLTPFTASLPSTESGYLSDWTSGWGIKPASDYLKLRAKSANVIVGTEGGFGTLPDGLQIYTDHIFHLTVIGVGLKFEQLPSSLVNARQYGDEVYLLINKSRNILTPLELAKLDLVASYPKPASDVLELYRFK